MNWKRIIVTTIVFLSIASIAVGTAEAKRQSTFDGHPAMVYEGSDIPSHLQPFVSKIVYDLPDRSAYNPPDRYSYREPGVQLYLTGKGRIFSQDWYIALSIADFITSQPEWKCSGSDRDKFSVATEIKWHAWNTFWTLVVNIEYFTKDMRNPPYF